MGRWAIRSAPYRVWRNSSGDWRYLFLPLSWALARILVPRRTVRIGTINFTLPCDNWITHFRWFLIHTKEREVRMFIDKYMKDDDLFFDVGANIGIYTIYASKRYAELKTICFEPEYSNLHYLKQNIIENSISDRVVVFSVAISDQVGTSKLHIQDFTPGAAVHSESKSDLKLTAEGYPVIWSEGIYTMTLDAMVKDLNQTPNAIKIDTDGNEAKILSGASELLANENLRCLILEIPENQNTADECVKILSSANFKLDWSQKHSRNQIWIRSN